MNEIFKPIDWHKNSAKIIKIENSFKNCFEAEFGSIGRSDIFIIYKDKIDSKNNILHVLLPISLAQYEDNSRDVLKKIASDVLKQFAVSLFEKEFVDKNMKDVNINNFGDTALVI
jgi:hypothetical protein